MNTSKGNLNELGTHIAQTGGLGPRVQAKLDEKGIKSPKISKGYHPNGRKGILVFQNPNSKETRRKWEKRMDEKYPSKINIK